MKAMEAMAFVLTLMLIAGCDEPPRDPTTSETSGPATNDARSAAEEAASHDPFAVVDAWIRSGHPESDPLFRRASGRRCGNCGHPLYRLAVERPQAFAEMLAGRNDLQLAGATVGHVASEFGTYSALLIVRNLDRYPALWLAATDAVVDSEMNNIRSGEPSVIVHEIRRHLAATTATPATRADAVALLVRLSERMDANRDGTPLVDWSHPKQLLGAPLDAYDVRVLLDRPGHAPTTALVCPSFDASPAVSSVLAAAAKAHAGQSSSAAAAREVAAIERCLCQKKDRRALAELRAFFRARAERDPLAVDGELAALAGRCGR